MGPEIAFRTRQNAIQNVDRCLATKGLAQGDALRQMGGKEGPAARRRQHRANAVRTQTIGIGLHHGGAFGPCRTLFQNFIICRQGGQIDLEDRASFFGAGANGHRDSGPPRGWRIW